MSPKILALVCLASGLATSPGAAQQNLVPNPSFDVSSGCPLGKGKLWAASSWYAPTFGSSDLFANCSITYGNGVPNNDFGWQQPVSGSTYAGMILYTSKHKAPNYREYVATTLTSPLQQGKSYTAKFRVSLADQSQYAIANIGVFLAAWPAGTVGVSTPLAVSPQIANPSGIITDKSGWTVIQGSFVAAGGEDHLIIGNFFDDAHTSVKKLHGIQTEQYAYYYIDDVSVTEDYVPYFGCEGNSFTPSNAVFEAEPCGADTNGGCNAAYGPPNTQSIPCPSDFVGQFWWDGATRDTDWFKFTVTSPSVVTLTVNADVLVDIFIFPNSCPPIGGVTGAGNCPALASTACLAPGDYLAIIAPSFLNPPLVCGASGPHSWYTANLRCDACGSGSRCCNPNGIGVMDPACAAILCQVDPACCEIACDEICEAEALLFCGGCPGCMPSPAGLVSWWTLDDTGSVAVDVVGHHNGTVSSDVIASVPGEIDECFQFDGKRAKVTVPHTPAHDFGCGSFTIDAWIRPEGFVTDGVILEKWSSSGAYMLFCDPNSTPSGQLNFYALSAPTPQIAASCLLDSGSTGIAPGAWSHVAVTSAPTGTGMRSVTLYANGISVGSTIFTTPCDCISTNGPLLIGYGQHDFNGPHAWRGELDEVQIFNRALSGAEITAIWAAGHSGQCK